MPSFTLPNEYKIDISFRWKVDGHTLAAVRAYGKPGEVVEYIRGTLDIESMEHFSIDRNQNTLYYPKAFFETLFIVKYGWTTGSFGFSLWVSEEVKNDYSFSLMFNGTNWNFAEREGRDDKGVFKSELIDFRLRDIADEFKADTYTLDMMLAVTHSKRKVRWKKRIRPGEVWIPGEISEGAVGGDGKEHLTESGYVGGGGGGGTYETFVSGRYGTPWISEKDGRVRHE